MTAGDSKAALTITPQPALAPSPQPRPARTARALPPGLVAQVGQNWTPIVGQNWMPIDSKALSIEDALDREQVRRRTGSRISGGSGRSWCLRWPRWAAGCRGGGLLRRRRFRVLVKDVLFDLLQFGDVARHLFLAYRDPVKAVRYLLLI